MARHHLTPLEQFNKKSRSTDMTEQLEAHYYFGKHLVKQSRQQIRRLQMDLSAFTIKSSMRTYWFFKHVRKHRIGVNLFITPSQLGKSLKQQLENLKFNKIFA